MCMTTFDIVQLSPWEGRGWAGRKQNDKETFTKKQHLCDSPHCFTHISFYPFYSSKKQGLPPHFRAAVQRGSTALFPKTIEASKAEIQLG